MRTFVSYIELKEKRQQKFAEVNQVFLSADMRI